MPGIKPGEKVGIHFSVPTKGNEKHFRLEGIIVRVMDSGVGINFPQGMDGDAMKSLMDNSGGTKARPAIPEKSAKSNRSASGRQDKEAKPSAASAFLSSGLGPADSKRIVAALRKEVMQVLPEMNTALFKYMDSELLELAKDAKSNAEQSEYFAAMSSLEKAKKQVGQDFMNEVVDQIDNPRNLETLLEERKKASEERKAASQSKRVKLSLVNTEEFEDWLAVANIISRSEKYLEELLIRMGIMVDSWAHNEANPLGVCVFSHAFDDAMRKVDLSKEVRQKVYTGYESKVIPLFRKLYITTTKLLEDSGLFPDIDEDFIAPAAKPVTTTPAEDAAQEAIEEEEEEDEEEVAEQDDIEEDEEEAELAELESELKNELRRRREERQGRRRQPSRRRARASSAGSRGRSRPPPERAPPQDVSEAISSIYGTVRELMYDDEDDDFAEEDYVDVNEVEDLLQELQSVQRESGTRLRMRQRLLETASADGRQRRLAPQAAESIEVVENLVGTIEEDEMLSDGVKDWVRQLELTLGKVATRQTDFLSDANPHKSVEVINQLARLGGAETGSVKRSVDKIIDNITTGFDSDPQVFDDALEQLQPLVERQSRAFTGNIQRTVKASEGQQTLRNAQRAVVAEMDKQLADKDVPEVLMKLLMPGWRNLMVNTHLRQGQDSSDWRKHVQALEQVVEHLDEDTDESQSENYIPPEELLTEIESGLDSISYEPGQRVPLLNSLRDILTGDEAVSELPKVSIEGSVADTLGFGEVTAKETVRQQIIEEKSGDHHWEKYRDRASMLHVGEWVEFLAPNAEPEIAIIAWASEDSGQLVFVNRRGVKTHELTVEELANMFADGTARVLEESDIPLTDRASHRMLQQMHNQLTHQATHDELTGLANRKEFERELERALDKTKRTGETHVVAYFDLDQFKVVNNTGGHDAGDQLLIGISKELLNVVPDNVILARLGGDEYGALVENSDMDAGEQVLKQIANKVRDYRFMWEEEQFSLTTSCGWVFVDESVDSVANILKGADSACIAAKDAGRDRIQIYTTDDTELASRKDVMEFVSQIDKALEEDRFVLNCQKISPVDEDSGEHAHYEILLTVLDETGEPMPPQDFIIAAETYNRMGLIDRWVIKNSFKFIASNILKLEDLGAFSINVSGNSLTEDDFMEFVLEQFNETRLPTSRICFEITETSAIGNLDDVVEFMEKLKIIGVEFSLDDFGTGLSSYSYLRNLPVDYLKIDGIFVKDIKTNPSDYAVVKSINEIGHFMGKKTIAEYVEDDEVLEILQEIGVDFAQGFGVEKKRPIVELLTETR
jgi:diguanylate cyclase (GGDEF)-like protein